MMPEMTPFNSDNLLYIELPESMNHTFNDFAIDPKIKLPIEKPEDQNWDPKDLSWEMIISAMLKIMAYNRDHQNFDYYRSFIRAVKPDLEGELFATGLIKAGAKNFPLAIEIFRAIEGLEPDNYPAIINLALVYEGLGKEFAEKGHLEEAKELKALARERYIKALDHEPPLPEAYWNAGFFYLGDNDLERAKSLFETFINLSDDSEKIQKIQKVLNQTETRLQEDTLFKEAYDYILLGQEKKGIEKVKAFLERHPQVWNGWFLLGWAHRRLNEFEKALPHFQKALTLDPEQEVDLLNEMAICEMELNNLSQSRTYLEKALMREPENIKIISNLGVLALKSGEKDEAKGFFLTVLEISPEDPLARKFLAEIG